MILILEIAAGYFLGRVLSVIVSQALSYVYAPRAMAKQAEARIAMLKKMEANAKKLEYKPGGYA